MLLRQAQSGNLCLLREKGRAAVLKLPAVTLGLSAVLDPKLRDCVKLPFDGLSASALRDDFQEPLSLPARGRKAHAWDAAWERRLGHVLFGGKVRVPNSKPRSTSSGRSRRLPGISASPAFARCSCREGARSARFGESRHRDAGLGEGMFLLRVGSPNFRAARRAPGRPRRKFTTENFLRVPQLCELPEEQRACRSVLAPGLPGNSRPSRSNCALVSGKPDRSMDRGCMRAKNRLTAARPQEKQARG